VAVTSPQQPDEGGDFQVLFAGPGAGAGPAARTVLDRLAFRGLRVTTTRSWAGAAAAIRTPAAPVGVAVLSWELFGSGGELVAALDDILRLSAPPAIVVISESGDEQVIPAGVRGRTAGWFWLHADSPHFVADQVEWLMSTYALRSQVLGALAARTAAADLDGAGPDAAGPGTAAGLRAGGQA
jgi:hypothetical protein